MAELLVAFTGDPAGSRMASHLATDMEEDGVTASGATAPTPHGHGGGRIAGFWRSRHYDLMTIHTPAISADWLEEEIEAAGMGRYDGYVFLSKHYAESGVLALTCHSTGNFGEAKFGGNDSEVAIPHPHLQKAYLRNLHQRREESAFAGFDVTIEATHHGPSALGRPVLFIEVGTTPKQWNDDGLCGAVADVVHDTITSNVPRSPVAICFGGTHYPKKFTDEILDGACALGTVIPKRAVRLLGDDDGLFPHIVRRNGAASEALLDWGGIPGPDRKGLEDLLSTTSLRTRRI